MTGAQPSRAEGCDGGMKVLVPGMRIRVKEERLTEAFAKRLIAFQKALQQEVELVIEDDVARPAVAGGPLC